jgi:hypothetical protein
MPIFNQEFATLSDDKLIIDSLAKLSHRPNENPRMFFSRLEELMHVLKENYASYRVKPDRPAQHPQGGDTKDNLKKYTNNSVDNFANFLFTQMFRAAAPENVRQLLSHKDRTRLMVEDAYKIFFTKHHIEMYKKVASTAIHAVSEDQEAAAQEQEVAAFCPQQKQQTWAQQHNFNNHGNQSRGQGFSRSNFNNRQNSNQPRYNTARNGKFCVYCKILNHTQEECRKCIQDNKPCVNNKEQLYWPKINSATENTNAVQNNSDPNNGVSLVFCKELHGTAHECSECHFTIVFEFMYYFHRKVQ